MRETLTCYRCGDDYREGHRKRCTCGEPLWYDSQTDVESESMADFEGPGVWRYRNFLPTSIPTGLARAAGGTPLFKAKRLTEYAGCELHIKDEGENPTGSFKDRGSTIGVSRGIENGHQWIGTVSHGNMAMSVAALAASAGLNCAVFVPEEIPVKRLDYITQYDPQLVKVSGDYGQLYYDILEIEKSYDIEFINSDAPDRIAGQKTVAMEICESFAPGLPDAIALPVSSGGHASAVWQGLRELFMAGLIDKMPRLYLSQATACAPIADAFTAGNDEVKKTTAGETIAFSIANGDPPSGNRALTAVRETGGTIISVTDAEIEDAMGRLATRAGVCAEPASATTLAGVRKLANRGEIESEDKVVAIVTGTGFKEDPVQVDTETERIPRENLKSLLDDVIG